jgi:hypothetical protein
MKMINEMDRGGFVDGLHSAREEVISREIVKMLEEHGELDDFIQFGMKKDCSKMLSIVGPRAVEPVVKKFMASSIYSDDANDRELIFRLIPCMQYLERIEDPGVADPLWKLINEDPELNQPYQYVPSTGFPTRHEKIYETQGYILRALANLGDKRIENKIVEGLQSEDFYEAITSGESLAKLYANDLKRLLPLLDDADTYKIFYAIVKIGDSSTVDPLIFALGRFNDKDMAVVLLNCGNPSLESAAKEWATQHGYEITTNSSSYAPAGWGMGN